LPRGDPVAIARKDFGVRSSLAMQLMRGDLRRATLDSRSVDFGRRRISMAGFLLRIVIVAIGLWLASELISGIDFRDGATLAVASLLLGIVNAFVRPIAVLLTLPLSIITLGFFLLVINAGMLGLVAWLLDGFSIAGFWSALFGSIIVSITGWLASWFIGPRGRVEVMVVHHRG
jgi:putative membrane protein